MILILIRAIGWFSQIIVLMLLARAILSWFVQSGGNSGSIRKVYYFLCALTEPLVAPCRKFLRRFNTGMFDFSVLLAMLLVEIVARILIRILILLI